MKPVPAEEAARILLEGGVVIFPTETVYGVGAHPGHEDAVRRLSEIKQRPPTQPFSLHLSRHADPARFVADVPAPARRLMDAFWPGPLTVVLRAEGGGTVGLRVPDHPVADALFEAAGGAVTGTSANRHGGPSPSTLEEALDALGDRVDAAVDGGPCRVGIDSTVVDLSGQELRVLRAGGIPLERIVETAAWS